MKGKKVVIIVVILILIVISLCIWYFSRNMKRDESQMRTNNENNYSSSESDINRQYSYNTQEILCDNDGATIYGIAYIPEREGKMPLVIFSHELCSTYRSGIDYAEFLAERGIATYTFDFRGGSSSSRSDGRTTQMSLMTEVSDLESVLETAKTWNFVDTSKITLLGASQGGAVTALVSANHQDEIAGSIIMYPALVICDEVHSEFNSLDEVPETFNFLGWIRVGKNYVSDIWNLDLYGEISKYTKPMLIIHGSSDSIVPISYSQRAEQVMENAELKTINGAGHGFYGTSFDLATEYIWEYLQENNCI